MTTRSTLIVTNDFPPRQGGIQSFVHEIALRLPRDTVVVYASTYDGAAAFDAEQPFPVVRHGSGLLIPGPDARRRIRATMTQYGTTSVWFGASAPLGLLGADLRGAGATRVVATTHGHEVGWARLPVARQALRRIGRSADVVTYLGEYTRRRIEGAFGPHTRLEQLTPGVDVDTFRPDVDGLAIRARYGLGRRPVIVCVSRLVPRKGQDTLIRALPLIRREIRDAALLIVGRGPDEARLRRLARETAVDRHVVVTGGVPAPHLPRYYAAGDVFAMPCRTRRGGLDVEGLGIVYLEASATGLPVVAGNSGGAPEAVRPGETGYVVDGRDTEQVARQLVALLSDRALARRLGAAGRTWVERDWTWQHMADRLAGWLAPTEAESGP